MSEDRSCRRDIHSNMSVSTAHIYTAQILTNITYNLHVNWCIKCLGTQAAEWQEVTNDFDCLGLLRSYLRGYMFDYNGLLLLVRSATLVLTQMARWRWRRRRQRANNTEDLNGERLSLKMHVHRASKSVQHALSLRSYAGRQADRREGPFSTEVPCNLRLSSIAAKLRQRYVSPVVAYWCDSMVQRTESGTRRRRRTTERWKEEKKEKECEIYLCACAREREIYREWYRYR